MSVTQQFPIARPARIVPVIPRRPLSRALADFEWRFCVGGNAGAIVDALFEFANALAHARKVEDRALAHAVHQDFFALFATLKLNVKYN